MREAEVEAAFVAHLIERGWGVTTDKADHVDVLANRGSQVLVAEVKGKTSSPGTDVDTLYGQLLRRMERPGDDIQYAVVVPESLSSAVLRVPTSVRQKLDVVIFLVDDFGRVRVLGPE